jgi:AraC family transcriptional regulator
MIEAAHFSGRVIREFGTTAGSIAETEHPHAVVPPHSHPQATFCLVMRGEIRECASGSTSVHGENALIFRYPQERHANEFGAGGARCFNVLVDPGLLEKAPPAMTHLAAAAPVMKRLTRELRRGPSALVVEGLLYQLIGEACRHPARAASGVAIAASEIIRERFTGPMSVQSLAQELGVHPVHLMRAFRKEFGTTLVEAVRILRIGHAKDLLRGSRPIADIALTSGFADQSHFTKVFRRATGTTPRRYRLRFR